MEDMHIHLRDGIINQEVFNEYVDKCIELHITKAVFLEHGNRISLKHNPVLFSKNIIDEFNHRFEEFYCTHNSQKLKLIRGIEIDYSDDISFREKTFEILDYGKFDWIVGAIHSLKFKLLKDYLLAIIDMINNYPINVIAHLQLNSQYLENEKILIEIMKMCYKRKIFIEINTSDRSRWDDNILYFILNLMKKYNVKYVFSSDAHNVNDIGYMIDETMKKVRLWKKTK